MQICTDVENVRNFLSTYYYLHSQFFYAGFHVHIVNFKMTNERKIWMLESQLRDTVKKNCKYITT
jgi:hypothetical protein